MNSSYKTGSIELLISQPVLTSYRLPVFKKLAEQFNTLVITSPAHNNEGFGTGTYDSLNVNYFSTLKIGPSLFYQYGILRSLMQSRPERLLITANPRNLSYWLALFLCKMIGTKVYSHGHGLFNKPHAGSIHKLIYRLMVSLSTFYICYTTTSQQSMIALGANSKKLRVADNSLCNEFAIPFPEKHVSGNNLLFVGRLRQGSGLDLLLNIFPLFNQQFPEVVLHIIGDGDLADNYKAMAKNNHHIIFHGELYDDCAISSIAKHCILGVYPGNAGLSIVHLMSFSLPPLIHNNFYSHGPEASYVIDGINGYLFEQGNADNLLKTLISIFTDYPNLMKTAANAFDTYTLLNNPDLAGRLLTILHEQPG